LRQSFSQQIRESFRSQKRTAISGLILALMLTLGSAYSIGRFAGIVAVISARPPGYAEQAATFGRQAQWWLLSALMLPLIAALALSLTVSGSSPSMGSDDWGHQEPTWRAFLKRYGLGLVISVVLTWLALRLRFRVVTLDSIAANRMAASA
jgi:uncharacterized BrkB/YihY/UPF0761 family membrane protein